MFDFVNKKKRLVQIIMALAVLPFLFWGVESYRTDGGESILVDVDGEKIQRREFEQALRDQQDRMRSMLGSNLDSSILDNPEMRISVLERLVQQRLLRRESVNVGMTVLDSQLVRVIGDIPEFQQNGRFSNQRYQELLRAQGLSPLNFESRMREELMLQQLLEAYSENGFISETVAKKIMYLSEVQRDINQFEIQPDQFLLQINLDEAEIESYYKSHQAEFNLPERARVEYVILSLDEFAGKQQVDEDEAREYFAVYQNNYVQPEERQASHILFALSADASDEERAAVQNKANEVLEQVRQDPAHFAEIAEQYSEDPGSAGQGGGLGFFGRGIMVKVFEDEIFQMQPDEISGLVETDFGFHIIKLTAIKEAREAGFDEVKAQIEHELKKHKAGAIFGEIAEDFSNTVYEQSDTLQVAAEEFGLPIHKSDWIDMTSKTPAILANERLLQAIFSYPVVDEKRNTDAIEVMPDTFVAARILDHRAASIQSLMVVRDEIIDRLKKSHAADMAVREGENLLARLQEGAENVISWSESKQVSYIRPQNLDSSILQVIFKTELSELPTYAGMASSEGSYTLIRINHAIEPDMTANDVEYQSLSGQLQQMVSQEEMSAYLSELRQRYDVKFMEEVF
ncbi:MAG: SurA N-terminal domain-containing protein [Nitrosomonas sp.]|nr:SurA N-terminal domain-containing protein [Nitrosomonas sp.]MDP1952018.1 SurA N-terminal domain-containing protein [Nitrosomonas sp.]